MTVFLAEGFFTGVDEGFFALGVVEVFVELFAFAFGVVVGFFFGGIILQVHELQGFRGLKCGTILDCYQQIQE